MHGHNQQEGTTDAEQPPLAAGKDETVQVTILPHSLPARSGREFDWLAIGIILLLAALFALLGRLNAQPPTSLTPVAVLSATGCGLLVTGIRKLHTLQRPGLLEASIAGLFLAVFQFMAALTYPNILYVLSHVSDERVGFLTTWGLVMAFSVIFSIGGAALGHLAFAPLRPLPAKSPSPQASEMDEQEVTVDDLHDGVDEEQGTDAQAYNAGETGEGDDDEIPTSPAAEDATISPPRSLVSYLIAILLLGLFPTLVGYIFAAAFDYMLHMYQFFPGPYPTLRLLSTLLPWQVPTIINFNNNDPNATVFLLWQLWRIPLFLGNPTMFDVQALEPLIFNAAALALLLLTIRNFSTDSVPVTIPWSTYLLLEMLFGLLLVFPADLWMLRGLQGLLQEQQIVVPIRTLYILNTPTFLLNLVTGLFVCIGIAIGLRLLQKRWGQVKL